MIAADRLSKYYGAHAAVEELSFNIAGGEVVGLLGLNGAGKTTTLRLLSGLLLPTAGSIAIDGIDMATQPEAARARLGFLPETPPLYGEMRVAGFLRFVARLRGVRRPAPAVAAALEATDLTEVADQVIATLSHGYRRRIGIAQAIVHRPALVLLDEPTSGLDPVQIVAMRGLIQSLRGNHTILVSSHLLGEIHALCDRIFVLQAGRVAAVGTEAELAARVGHSTHVRIEVRGSAAALGQALAELPNVLGHRLEGEAQGLAQACVELQQDDREALAAALMGAGLGLRSMARVQLELENIFLRLTGHGTGP